MIEDENTTLANIMIPFLISWSQEKEWNIIKSDVFVFHHGIQHHEASGYTFFVY